MENAYPGSNILVVTLTNGESKRVEAQSDEETLKEAMEVLRNMFGADIPSATNILVPRWWNNRFQRGSYSNYPIYGNHQLVHNIKVSPRISSINPRKHYNHQLLSCILKSYMWFFNSGTSRPHIFHRRAHQ